MIAQHVAVVGKEDDERLLHQLAPGERLQDAADLFVHEAHGAVVSLARAAHLFHAEIAVPGVALRAAARREPFGPRGHDGGRQVRILVAPPEALRRVVGTVRAGERNLQEKWLGPLVAVDPRRGGLAGPRGGMQALGKRVGLGVEIVPADAGRVGIQVRRLRPEPAPVVAAEVGRFDAARFVQQGLMIAVEVALRMVVQLADGSGVVAGVAQGARHFERIARADFGVAQHAVIPRREAGEQRGARRRAGGSGGIGVGEADSRGGKLIQVRRVDGAVAGGAQAIGAPLVGHQQQNVGPRSARAPALPGGLRQKCRGRDGAVAQHVAAGHWEPPSRKPAIASAMRRLACPSP